MSIISSNVYSEINTYPERAFLGIQEFSPSDILSWAEIENYLNNPYFYTRDQVHIIDKTGKIKNLEEKKYPWSENYSRLSSKEVIDNINSGKSFYLGNFNKFSKRCNNLSKEIQENILNINLDFHIYGGITSYSESFSIHRDYANNIIMQIDGESHWKVYNSDPFIEERSLFTDEKINLLIDYVLKPGDLLYIPEGNYHKCNPLGKRMSISACFVQKQEELFVDTNWYSLNLN
jgi:ribosomal protein L16 Arg81 hydroxylase